MDKIVMGYPQTEFTFKHKTKNKEIVIVISGTLPDAEAILLNHVTDPHNWVFVK